MLCILFIFTKFYYFYQLIKIKCEVIIAVIELIKKLKMKNLYEGGQCNPNAIGASSNHYKRMMNNLAFGNQNPEKINDFSRGGQNFQQQIMQRQAMFKFMNQQFNSAQSQHEVNSKNMNMIMNEQMKKAEIQHENHMRNMRIMQQRQWMQAQQHMKFSQQAMQREFQKASLLGQAQQWKNQAIMQNDYKNAQISYQQQQESIHDSSASMLDTMMNDPDPRFQNSQFLQFLKKIQKGQIIIEGKQLRQVKTDTAKMQDAWKDAEKVQEGMTETMQSKYKNVWQQQEIQTNKMKQKLDEHWQNKILEYEAEYANTANFQNMLQQKYMDALKEMNIDLTESWKNATDLEQQLVYGETSHSYIFKANNPYLQAENPKVIACDLINKGQNNQAILALQAYLQKNMEDSETWRILGRILQENDQDQQSIPCFMTSLKYNPENLDCLLSLGVSCTNILDQVKAMNYLKKWIILNPKYQALKVDPNIIPDEYVNQYTYKIEEIKRMNGDLLSVFDQAAKLNPKDPELLTALAILCFLRRDYQAAIDLFKKALNLDPTNYLLMNKVGATLAHLGRTEQAIQYYHKALQIRPNYVRVWVNIGIAHAFKGFYQEAVRFYLNALSFRPDAKHVWSYLHTCFMSMQRYDLLRLISTQDPKAFKQFDVIDLNMLPEPEIQYAITTQKHILNKLTNQWLQQRPRKHQN